MNRVSLGVLRLQRAPTTRNNRLLNPTHRIARAPATSQTRSSARWWSETGCAAALSMKRAVAAPPRASSNFIIMPPSPKAASTVSTTFRSYAAHTTDMRHIATTEESWNAIEDPPTACESDVGAIGWRPKRLESHYKLEPHFNSNDAGNSQWQSFRRRADAAVRTVEFGLSSFWPRIIGWFA